MKVTIPPSIIHLPNKSFLVSGTNWIEVPSDTKLSNISQYMVYESAGKNPTSEALEFKVAGSRGNTYRVRCSENTWSCTCTGFSFRGRCKHIEECKKKVKKSEKK